MAFVAGKPVVMGWELMPEQNKFDQNEKTNGKGKQLASVRAFFFLENICQGIQMRMASSLEHKYAQVETLVYYLEMWDLTICQHIQSTVHPLQMLQAQKDISDASVGQDPCGREVLGWQDLISPGDRAGRDYQGQLDHHHASKLKRKSIGVKNKKRHKD